MLSCKVSGVQDLIALYRELAWRRDYALHLGLTEAGMGNKGIGDSIRASLTNSALARTVARLDALLAEDRALRPQAVLPGA